MGFEQELVHTITARNLGCYLSHYLTMAFEIAALFAAID